MMAVKILFVNRFVGKRGQRISSEERGFPDLQTTIAQRTSINTFSSYVGKIHLNGAVADNATNRLKLCWSGYLFSRYFVAQGLRPGFNYSQNQNKLKKYSQKGTSLPTAISLREFTRGTMEF